MSFLHKIFKALGTGFLVLIIVGIGVANYNHFTATPEEKAQWSANEEARNEVKKEERAVKQATELEKRKKKIEEDRLKAEQKKKEQVAKEAERQEKLAKAEQERIVKEQQEFLDEIPKYEKLAGTCSRTYIAALIDPKPSDFPIKNSTYDTERNLFRISSYVDTVNGFNAPVRQRYYCEISDVDLDAFTCQSHNCKWE